MAEEQDDLAAEWGLALAEQGVPPKGGTAADGTGVEGGDDMAAQWAAMIEDGGQFVQAGGAFTTTGAACSSEWPFLKKKK